MKNKNDDDEFALKQIYEAFGKPKGIKYKDFENEAKEMLKNIKVQREESENFRKEYAEKHRYCPKCLAEGHSTTLVGFPMYSDKREEYKDLNDCVCSKCGDKHTMHDRVGGKIDAVPLITNILNDELEKNKNE